MERIKNETIDTGWQVSYFQKITGTANTTPLNEVFDMIRTGTVDNQIKKIREAKQKEDYTASDRMKKKLPAFTPSGVFDKGHSKEKLMKYNPLIVLDIDKVGAERAAELKKKVAELETTYAAFISPSGDGLKILVQTDNLQAGHEGAYQQVADYYAQSLNVDIDLSGKDFSRLCFISHDPEIFVNDTPQTFISVSVTETPIFSMANSTSDFSIIQSIISYTDKLEKYRPGSRNNYVYLLASNLNRAGINKIDAEKFILSRYTDLAESELYSTISSAYSNTDQHGILSGDYFLTVNTVNTVTAVSVGGKNNQNVVSEIPQSVYNTLPDFLKEATSVFELSHERDIFLTSALATLSACFPTVSGTYDRRKFHANLFVFIIGGPGIGKGNALFARTIVEKVHDSIIEKFENSSEDRTLAQTFFIAADISASAIKRNLRINKGVGLIHDTEADALSNTLEQDWGGHSEIYRKAFQHEPISFTRNGRGEDIITGEIKRPKLSISLTGTPSQVPTLLKGTQDGLFSRIIFYSVTRSESPTFKDVFSKSSGPDLNDFFANLSTVFYEKFYLPVSSKQISFKLKEAQEHKFNRAFNEMLQDTFLQSGEDTIGIVYRLGLIAFRVAMIFTILRRFDGEMTEVPIIIECADEDLDTSLALSKVYLKHAISLYHSFPGKRNESSSSLMLLEFLPSSFSFSQALTVGTKVLNFSDKTVSNYLNALKDEGFINQLLKKGPYYKVALQ